ncbi:MAG: ATP synthase subunit I [Cyanobacteria bacterium J06648_16]
MSAIPILVALLVGLGLGGFYFGGLWLTVQQIPGAQQPLWLILASFALRLSIVLLGGYWLIAQHSGPFVLLPLLACAAGFLVARNLLVWRISRQP